MPDPAAVSSMFARIARRYDVANRLLSLGLDRSWRARLVREASRSNPALILDLATGSGDVAFALARQLPSSARIVGADFCQPMLDEAESKRRASPSPLANISFRQADALELPFEDKIFEVITIAFGLRNLADRDRGLRAMYRVLAPGGRLLVLEFSQPNRWFRPIYFFYLRHILPRLAGVVTGDRPAYDYLNESIELFPGRAELSAEIRRAGFGSVAAIPLTFGAVALHIATK